MQSRTDLSSVDNKLITLGVITRFKVPASVCRWISEIEPKSYQTSSDDAMSSTCILKARKYFGDKRLWTNIDYPFSSYGINRLLPVTVTTGRNSSWQTNLFLYVENYVEQSEIREETSRD